MRTLLSCLLALALTGSASAQWIAPYSNGCSGGNPYAVPPQQYAVPQMPYAAAPQFAPQVPYAPQYAPPQATYAVPQYAPPPASYSAPRVPQIGEYATPPVQYSLPPMYQPQWSPHHAPGINVQVEQQRRGLLGMRSRTNVRLQAPGVNVDVRQGRERGGFRGSRGGDRGGGGGFFASRGRSSGC